MDSSPIAAWGGSPAGAIGDPGAGLGITPPPELAELMARRDDGERFPAADEPLQLAGAALEGIDLSGLDLSGADLSYAELISCTLTGARLVRTDLTGAQLRDVDLSGAELLGAELSGADLANTNMTNAALLEATAAEAVFFGARCDGASFNGADLSQAEFRAAELIGASLVDTVLVGTDFSACRMSGADLAGADVAGASFRDADLRGARLRHVANYGESDWIAADITDADFTGAWNVRRHIQDVNYIHEFRSQSRWHEVLYHLWWATSDCGRSLLRWTLWSTLIALSYAALYNLVDIEWGGHDGPLSPVYFSIVTFTTLGFGDVTPTSALGEVLVMSEVILGYLSLGGMMSILSDKMARRAG